MKQIQSALISISDKSNLKPLLQILKKYNIEIYQKEWLNYATQLNWGIEKVNIDTDWVLRIDPDEIPSVNFKSKIKKILDDLPQKICGVSIIRRLNFLGKEIKFGGDFPQKGVRIWRNGKGKCENTWSDEHIIVDGLIEDTNLDIVDKNINNITWWTEKHNKFATREMIEFFLNKERQNKGDKLKLAIRENIKKKLKFKIYYNLPMFLRAFFFFIYKYFFRFGLVCGWQGFLWCFLQGFWYRVLVDLKILEIHKIMKKNNFNFKEAIKKEYGIDNQLNIFLL